MTEFTDIYDENNELLGTATREQAQANGNWIRSFHCWLVDASTERVIFQKRAANKRIYPSHFDISAAGHFISGERIEDGVRELKEELGLTRSIEQLSFLGIRTEVAKIGSATVREFAYTYLLVDHLPASVLRAEDAEVSALAYLPVREGLEIFSGARLATELDLFTRTHDGWIASRDVFEAKMAIPRKDPYYLKVLIMADRALKGTLPLAI